MRRRRTSGFKPKRDVNTESAFFQLYGSRASSPNGMGLPFKHIMESIKQFIIKASSPNGMGLPFKP